MKHQKILATALVFSFFTCNLSLAQPNYQAYYDNFNTYDNYVATQQTYVETTVPRQSFADKHPVLTALGVGLVVAGAITGGVMLANNCDKHHPRHDNHDCPPHRG